MGRLFLFIGLGVLGAAWVGETYAASLSLRGVVERTMAAQLRFDPFSRFLRITNSGNEAFRVQVSGVLKQQLKESFGGDEGKAEQVAMYLNSIVPAQMQHELDLKLNQPELLAKNTLNISILAP